MRLFCAVASVFAFPADWAIRYYAADAGGAIAEGSHQAPFESYNARLLCVHQRQFHHHHHHLIGKKSVRTAGIEPATYGAFPLIPD